MLIFRYLKRIQSGVKKSSILILLILTSVLTNGQDKISFGIHADPAICWFSSDNMLVKNDGARPGFNFGLTFNKYFASNYSFSTGISLVNTAGRLITDEVTTLKFTTQPVPAGEPVVYKIQYLAVPIGLKLQTNQIGYLTFFSDLGIDPKVVIGGKADIASLGISDVKATDELRLFNLSYHITAGIEYSLGGTTALVFGLNFDNNFLDVTKDNGDQPRDRVSQKILSFRLGINF